MMTGGNAAAGRQKDDFYPTPDDVTVALCRVVKFKGSIHEPCCGDGAMARVLTKHGYSVTGTDLIDRGFGSQVSIFDVKEPLGDNIVTNPPFNLAADIIEHCLTHLKPQRMAMVLKSTYWHAKTRQKLFQATRPTAVMPLLWRPDFLGQGRPTMEVMWCLWDARYQNKPTIYLPLKRP
jgi:hypothetical protein